MNIYFAIDEISFSAVDENGHCFYYQREAGEPDDNRLEIIYTYDFVTVCEKENDGVDEVKYVYPLFKEWLTRLISIECGGRLQFIVWRRIDDHGVLRYAEIVTDFLRKGCGMDINNFVYDISSDFIRYTFMGIGCNYHLTKNVGSYCEYGIRDAYDLESGKLKYIDNVFAISEKLIDTSVFGAYATKDIYQKLYEKNYRWSDDPNRMKRIFDDWYTLKRI